MLWNILEVNMKRIICFFLVACLLLTGFTVSAEERKEELPYYVDVVMKFGLMDLDNSTDFLGSESVSRGKAVGYILKLMNIKQQIANNV